MSLKKQLCYSILIAILWVLTGCSGHKNEKSVNNLRILTHNVWYGFTEVPDRKDAWLDWVSRQHPDIVFMQELNEYTPEKLAADAATWGHEHSVLLKEEGFPTGITSRFPIENVVKTLDGFHHGLIRAQINGIYCYCIHLHPSNWQARRNETDLILADTETLPRDARIILAGDFNALSPYDSAYYDQDRMTAFFASLDADDPKARNLHDGHLDYSVPAMYTNQGFIDTEYALRGADYAFTGSFPTKVPKKGEHGDRRRLDYVFVNASLMPFVQSSVIVSNDTTEYLSDHLPMIVDFRFE